MFISRNAIEHGHATPDIDTGQQFPVSAEPAGRHEPNVPTPIEHTWQ